MASISDAPGRRHAFLAAAIALTAALLAASFFPLAGEVFGYGSLHYVAHFAAFMVLALAWRRALPGVSLWAVLAGVVAFGFAQEAIEVAGHAHGFEFADALIDAAGALAGLVLAGAAQGAGERG